MEFLFPLGLIGLVGIPILIILYILKRKYTEQVVSSTYLWILSERFLKRKIPLSKIAGLIALIVQLLTIALLSLTIAHPVFVVEGGARDYCFILDGSGSMNMLYDDEGTTRYEKGKQEIIDRINSSADGSTFTVIAANTQTTIVCENETDPALAIKSVESLTPDHGDADFSDALGVAEFLLHNNKKLNTVLVTDKSYNSVTSLELVNVAKDKDMTLTSNYALGDLTYEDIGQSIRLSGNVYTYGGTGTLNLDVYVDNESDEPIFTAPIEVFWFEGEENRYPFEMTIEVLDFSSIEVRIREADLLDIDNTYTVFNIKSANSYKTLVVSDNPTFITNGLDKASSADVTVVPTKGYIGQTGYDLYIFDCFNPAAVPEDGNVWFINPTANIEGAGFSFKEDKEFDTGYEITKSNSNKTLVKSMLEGIDGSGIYVKQYSVCGHSSNYIDLFSYKSNPMIFMGTNDHGNRTVVFAFDLHTSNLAAIPTDYVPLLRNLLDYSFPSVIDRVNYKSGETLQVNVMSGSNVIEVDTPLGKEKFPEYSGAIAELVLTESGVYTVNMFTDTDTHEFYVFVESPECERLPAVVEDTIGLQGEADPGSRNGSVDNLWIFIIVLAVLFTVDWMVYCYEKYLLR